MRAGRTDRDRSSLRHMLVSGGGSLIAPVINLLAIPVVMRLYDPADYGVWGLIISLAFLLGQVSTLRYELAAVVERDDARAGRIITISLIAVASVTLLSVLVAPFLPSLFSGQSWSGSLAPRMWALPAIVAAMGLKLVADGWAVRAREFSLRAVGLVTLAVATNGAQIGLWHAGVAGADGLIIGSLIGFSLSALVQLVRLAVVDGPRLRPLTSWTGLGALAAEHRRFPLFSTPYTILGNMRREGLKIITGAWGSEAMVGLVAFSWRLTYFPAQACSNGIRPVLFERAASSNDMADVGAFIGAIQKWLLFIALPGLIVFEIWAEPIIEALFSAKWLPAVPMVRILAVPAVLFVLTGWLDRVFDVLSRQDLALRLELLFTVISLGAFSIGLWVLQSLEAALGLLSFVFIIYYLVILATIRSLLNNQAKHPAKPEGGAE